MSSQVLRAQTSQEVNVWVEFLRGHRGVTGQLNALLLQQHGLTISDFEVLAVLSQAEEQSMRRIDIAEAVVLSPSGVTRLLKGLENSGWVEKRACVTDARVSYAKLTESGQAKLDEAAASHLETIRGFLADLYSPDELEKLRELLSRLPGAEAAACDAIDSAISDQDGHGDSDA